MPVIAYTCEETTFFIGVGCAPNENQHVKGCVRALQAKLACSGAEIIVNGCFDQETLDATKIFQAEHGIKVSGIIGKETLMKLQ